MDLLRIAICQSKEEETGRLAQAMEEYGRQEGLGLSWHAFSRPEELLQGLAVRGWDLVLLDQGKNGSGLELARTIRACSPEVEVAVLADTATDALQGYSVPLLDYLLRPVEPERLHRTLDWLVRSGRRQRAGLLLNLDSGTQRVRCSQIAYVEVQDKLLYFHLDDGTNRAVRAPLRRYEDILLRQPGFMKVHRSYIVNLWHMVRLTDSRLETAGGQAVPISRLLYSQVRRAFLALQSEP